MEYKTIEKDGWKEIWQIVSGKGATEKLRYIHKWQVQKDAQGEHKVFEKPNGICTRMLRKPSAAYKKKMADRQAIFVAKQAIEDEKTAIRLKIEEKKKDMAIQELLSSGGITQAELDKIGE